MSKNKHFGTTGLFAQPIGKGLAKYHKSVFDKSKLELIRLGTNWPKIVGDFAAESSSPAKIQYLKNRAILHINATSAIALELQHMQPIILERVSKLLGHNKIQQIKLIQS